MLWHLQVFELQHPLAKVGDEARNNHRWDAWMWLTLPQQWSCMTSCYLCFSTQRQSGFDGAIIKPTFHWRCSAFLPGLFDWVEFEVLLHLWICWCSVWDCCTSRNVGFIYARWELSLILSENVSLPTLCRVTTDPPTGLPTSAQADNNPVDLTHTRS